MQISEEKRKEIKTAIALGALEALNREDIPSKIKILGIAAAQVELGSEMSPDVREAVPAAVEKLQEMVVEMLEG